MVAYKEVTGMEGVVVYRHWLDWLDWESLVLAGHILRYRGGSTCTVHALADTFEIGITRYIMLLWAIRNDTRPVNTKMSSGRTGPLDLSHELLLNVASFCEGRTRIDDRFSYAMDHDA